MISCMVQPIDERRISDRGHLKRFDCAKILPRPEVQVELAKFANRIEKPKDSKSPILGTAFSREK